LIFPEQSGEDRKIQPSVERDHSAFGPRRDVTQGLPEGIGTGGKKGLEKKEKEAEFFVKAPR